MAFNNPFLFEETPVEGVQAPISKPNPFIDSEADANRSSQINPFSDDQNSYAPMIQQGSSRSNPFADMDEPLVIAPAVNSDNIQYTDASFKQPLSQMNSHKMTDVSEAPSVSDETLHLLVSVTGHLEATSDTLVGQLDQVKTPRHSPPSLSKTPSPTADHTHDAAFSAVFAQTVEELSDQEHENTEKFPVAASSCSDPVTSTIAESSPASQINLWDTSAAPKTKDQILSLFNSSSNQNQGVDLLSSPIEEGSLIQIGDETAEKNQSNEADKNDILNGEKKKEPDHNDENLLSANIPSISLQKPSSPSQEAPLKPLDLALTALPFEESSKDCLVTEGHTAEAFMNSYVTSDHQSVITPPTPISPIEPSPMPTVVSTPVVEEKKISDPGQHHTDKTDDNLMASFWQPSSTPNTEPIVQNSPADPHSLAHQINTPTTSTSSRETSHAKPPQRPPPPPRPSAPQATSNIFASSPTKNTTSPFPSTGGGKPHATHAADSYLSGSSSNPFAAASSSTTLFPTEPPAGNQFDDFSKRFDNAFGNQSGKTVLDFDLSSGGAGQDDAAWGTGSGQTILGDTGGFGDDSTFDSFLSLTAPPAPHSTPARVSTRQFSGEEDKDISVVIRPRQIATNQFVPALAPPPRTQTAAFQEVSDPGKPIVNPFLTEDRGLNLNLQKTEIHDGHVSESAAETPLYDEDVSQPLEPFPRTEWQKAEFHMYLRHPNKKKITGQRFWKKIFVRLADNSVLQVFNDEKDGDPFQELPLQACYSVSDIGTQQFDQYGKLFTIKLQYIFYKERPGVRPGQLSKAEKITKKLGQFAMSAWEGDYDRVKEFASDVRKLGMPLEHAPQISQLLKLGTQSYEDLKLLSSYIEESLFKLSVTRDRALTYKTEEVQITGVDEVYIELDAAGSVFKQIARVRLFFLAFLSGMPDVELGMNDLRRQGKEVVGRHDIIPVATEEWIRLEDITFHSIIDQQAFEETKILKFKPPDGCYLELMRYRIRPPRGRELPLQVKVKYTILKQKVEIFSDILVPGYTSRKMGQIPCEDVSVRIPLPDCWVYMFRVEKHFRYGSVKAAHRRQGKVKGLERIIGAVDTLEQSLMEVSSGTAKYERQHKAIVWRIPRLPKEGQGAYTNHTFSCKMSLTSFDQMPDSIDKYFVVEYTMPHTTVSHTVCRSVSLSGGSGDNPEKCVRYLARYEYKQEVKFCYEEKATMAYSAATMIDSSRPEEGMSQQKLAPVSSGSDSDSD